MKALVIIFLTLGIFGGAYYATWVLYLKPAEDIRNERAAPPAPPPPDPALPEFERARATQEQGDIAVERAAWQDFLARYPKSSKADAARERLGQINSALFFSGTEGMGKIVYIVKPGDVITRVANKLKSTPELVMRINNLSGSMLRIGQRLVVAPANFSLSIDRKAQKVMLLQEGKFFKQYQIVTMPPARGNDKKPPAKPQKIAGRVTEKLAWNQDNTRITFVDPAYPQATHWILISPGGHNLYTETGAATPHKPPGGGYGLAPESMQELAALLRKSDDVTLE